MRATSPTAIKKIAMNYAKAARSHNFTRVGKSFTDDAEVFMIAWIKNRINKHPSKGKTLR